MYKEGSPVLLNPKANTSIGFCLFAGGRVSMSLDCDAIVNMVSLNFDDLDLWERISRLLRLEMYKEREF